MKFKFILILILSFLSLNHFALFGDEKASLLQNEQNTIDIYRENGASVVNVSNFKLAKTGWFFDFDIMEVPSGTGSGLVWDNKGHIITNFHVIQGGDSFLISFKNDKTQYPAKLVGVVPAKDIAVLKLEKLPKNLKPVTIGSSTNLMVGQKALAIGNPFGLDQTITQGIISALERKIKGIGGVKIHGMIQTDCAINPGNSGGPLFNSKGEVIGMNTMIFSHSGSSAGIGFAVPINTIKSMVPQLIKHGKITRPGLGITVAEEYVKAHFGIKKGIIIKYIPQDSPAAKAGLEGMSRDQYGRYYIGDIILKIDKYDINSFDDIYNTLENYKIGDKVKVTYERHGKLKTVDLKLIKI